MAHSVIWVLLLASSVAAQSRNPMDYPTVCRVKVPSGGGSQSLGSGTCVYSQALPPSSYVLTAAHVVRGGTGAPSVVFPDGRSHQCRVAYNNPRQDVAILHFNEARPAYTQISQTLPGKGESVTFVGFGGQRPYFLAYHGPVVGAVGSGGGERDTLEAYVPQISQGDSGGAVLYKGLVVGTISAKDNRGNGLASVVAYRQPTQYTVPVYGPPPVVGYRPGPPVPVYGPRPQVGAWHPTLTPKWSLLPCIERYKRGWVYIPYASPPRPYPPQQPQWTQPR